MNECAARVLSMCRCYEIIKDTSNASLTSYNANPYLAYIDLQPIRNIYIHNSLGCFNTIGANDETSIVEKVHVSSNFMK